jgi:large repetitive protein
VVPTDANGVATAPVLTAGNQPGPIVVTASAGSGAAPSTVFHLTADSAAPSAPTIDSLGNGDGQVTVGFSGATAGTAPITGYQVTATDKSHTGAPLVTATGTQSPITVSGLVNGDTYTFTVLATSADGNSPPSAPSGALNVGVPPTVKSGPADGVVGQSYSSGFTVTGAPTPTVTFISGDVPPGLTLGANGNLTGTPTQAGSYEFTVQVDNHVGTVDDTVTVTISSQ